MNSKSPYNASLYNYFVKDDAGHFVGYNFLYRSIIRLPNEAFSQVETWLKRLAGSPESEDASDDETARLPAQWVEALKQAKFVIDRSFDEIAFLKFRYYHSLFSGDSLSIIVLPTLSCNFDCPYCFECKKPGKMTRDVEDALVSWIDSNYRNKRYIHVSWFGGEPLLAKDTIIRLSGRVQELCSEIGAKYSSSMTTNGFFLDRQFQSAIPSLGIKNIQVTLDGDREAHDSLRRQKNGEGSFDRIFENIIAFCEGVKSCRLSLRINCGDANYHSIRGLMERFPPVVKEKTTIFFRWIWANKASGYRDFSCRERGEDPFKGLADLYLEMNRSRWRTQNPHNSLGGGYCEVDFLDHYSIDPDGNLYLCTHSFDRSESIGSVFLGNDFIEPGKLGDYLRWYSINPFEDSTCTACNLLPFCMGGCRMSRFKGHRECIEEKGSRDLFVRTLVKEQLCNRQSQSQPYVRED